ncbi:MAG: hypothetical protein QOF11_1623 [Chloroflexota bacterium]|jgi:hypothetical protein|nr:hypothetical protein [Chloroflexota bacterium]
MTDQRQGSSSVRRSRGPGRATLAPSAGLPAGDPADAAERIAELEARLARLETGLRDRGRELMGRVMPPEATRHFRNAGREQLLGVRSIVDFWIARIDAAETHSRRPARGRQRIDVD